jgi:hypothetical protein
MKCLKNSNSRVRLVELEDGTVGFAAKVAPLLQERHYWYADKKQAILIFYPAELVKAGECELTKENVFGYEAQCENETHFFPTFEALEENRIQLSCEDAYLFSNCDPRQNNPVVGVHVKEAPNPKSFVYGIRKGTEYIPLQGMVNLKYSLIDWFIPKSELSPSF